MLGKNRTDLETGRERIRDRKKRKTVRGIKKCQPKDRLFLPLLWGDKGTWIPGSRSERRLSLCFLPEGYRDTGVPMAKWEGRRGAVEILREPKSRYKRNSQEG